MKYQLLWAACFVGLLQLSAVASRSTVDEEIINKENAKYSTTTVGPTVAYTGQEVERGVNSSDKLAVDPGPMSSSGASYGAEVWAPIAVIIFLFLLMLLGCLCKMLEGYQEVDPRNIVTLQNGGQIIHVQNFQAEYHSQQKQQSMSTEYPPSYESVQQPQALTQYPPVHQVGPYQYSQHQFIPPIAGPVYQVTPTQAQTQQRPPVVEFENPLKSTGETGELQNK